MPERVLLIDDDPRLVAALQIRLEAAGYVVQTASRGDEGIAAAQSFRPHVIILDIQMPGMNGFEVCRHIRCDPELCNTPLIVISATGQDSVRQAAAEAGANCFVAKPYQFPQVMAKVRAAIDGEYAAGSSEKIHSSTPAALKRAAS